MSSDREDVSAQVFFLANLTIMLAYAAIMVAIVVPVARAGQLRTNRLATATAMIFFSCAVGHGLHAVMAYRAFAQVSAVHPLHDTSLAWSWASAGWDAFTAIVGVYYWSLRRGYGVLLGKGAIYVDPWGQRRLDEVEARERAAQDAAEAHRATLATVVERLDDGVIGLTPEGVITAWNGGAERLFGYTAAEVLGRRADMFVDDADGAGQQLDALARMRRGERSLRYEARRLRKDGTPVDVALTIAPIEDQAGQVIGVSALARDITAAKEAADRQRALEQRTHQAERMESLGNLAGGVAHDFNNVLAIIANYTAFAMEETADRPHVQADLSQVRTAVERATALTRQLLTFTRGDAIQPRNVDLNAAVSEVQAMLERTIGEHITLTTVLSAQPLTVYADPSRLHQVLLNLAINARDAMPDGGTLILEANTTTLDGDGLDMQPAPPAGTYARLLVSDTGQGMPPEVVARIFEPFFTTKPRGQGTGLGLATVYGIVTEAGGAINVYSEPGIGTTFRIYLPLAADSGPPVALSPQDAPPHGDGRTVLVVEDEPALARVVARILTNGGYHVLAAENGPQALSLFAEHGCDVLLTDVIMPEMSGPRLATLVHRTDPGLPVLYMSGYSNGLLGTTHELDDDIAFIEKPFTAADLLRKVASLQHDGDRHVGTSRHN
ncbi:PAS domain S-box-containing protein [Catenuloplanes nepalensis]|uniref:histidine kinase n=1 Tax=Catenuloplanes nepalensis TaxID=587533 RepID=A0ABT9MP47_9ACTN|nr:PAS domain-containing sensor histidine kinase [Catenuloplanes nepalensis]MDP9793168.1 PAS domain S-box-containing protein [Catenuloplanes nepalensis]